MIHQRIWIAGALGAAALISYAVGCSGPQSLRTAIRSSDEDWYARTLRLAPASAKDSYYLWKAEQTGQSAEQVAAADAALSTTRNPFRANSDPGAVSRGAVIYKVHCASCHGDNVDGHGPAMKQPLPLMDFHSFAKRFAVTVHGGAPRMWFRKINEGFVSEIRNADGSKNEMPAFKDQLAREQIWLAITYLQSLDAHAASQPHDENHAKE